jgi:hypothetical protein
VVLNISIVPATVFRSRSLALRAVATHSAIGVDSRKAVPSTPDRWWRLMADRAREILNQLPALLREDDWLRFELWRILSQEFAAKADIRLFLDSIEQSRRDSEKRFEVLVQEVRDLRADMDRRFEVLVQEVRDLRADMDRRFEVLVQEVRDLRADMDRRFEATERRFEAIDRRQDDLQSWVGTVVGGFQVRAGRRLEDAVAGTLRIALRMTDVDPDKITLRRQIMDATGRMGPPGRTYEIDIVATNGESWVFEVKSVADQEDIERFNDKAELAIAAIPLPGARKALITLDKSPDVLASCARLGIVVG